ncbi:aspartate--tRNA(Asn) ligase [Candidatus Woesearchaeota archaeon CG10_big_fil_rev_8_21_14_0_10_32_24]|nr:MAG: aspartate--tRNA(Asn) ligase [Candidatus Woesearchaeota archaeon CG10_big_fil_rev_8_21_14_0_10_32_24]
MERTLIKDLKDYIGKEVLLKGWVSEMRNLSKVKFIILYDRTGDIQSVANKTTEEASFSAIDDISKESVIELIGTVKEHPESKWGFEVVIKKVTVIAVAEIPLPVDPSEKSQTHIDKRLDYRFLDLHSKRTQSIFKVQSTILQGFRDFMYQEGALEVTLPSIIGASSEGGTDLFTIKYFEKEALLSQSCQLYKQMLACSMEKIFTVFTAWRAEKHNTVRHLNESRQFDYEEAFAGDKRVMAVLTQCVQFMIKKVLQDRKKELEFLGVDLKVPKEKYITFEEVREIMKREGIEMPAHDLSGEAEKKLGVLYPHTIVYVHEWPLEGKPFYIMPHGKNSKGFDAIWQGMEITSGGQRVHDPKLLEERLKAQGLDLAAFKDYINSFRYGAPPHAGWGLGLERFTMLMLGLDNIREAVLFPRDRDRLTP